MIEFLQSVGALYGIGALFAVILFIVLVKVVRLMRDDRKYWEVRLSQIVDRYDETTNKNTTVLTELIVYLKARNGSK